MALVKFSDFTLPTDAVDPEAFVVGYTADGTDNIRLEAWQVTGTKSYQWNAWGNGMPYPFVNVPRGFLYQLPLNAQVDVYTEHPSGGTAYDFVLGQGAALSGFSLLPTHANAMYLQINKAGFYDLHATAYFFDQTADLDIELKIGIYTGTTLDQIYIVADDTANEASDNKLYRGGFPIYLSAGQRVAYGVQFFNGSADPFPSSVEHANCSLKIRKL